MKKFSFYTGPTIVDRVALRLSEAGLLDVWAGTQHVYFSGVNLTEAQAAVKEVFPHAGFEVQG